jgi:hypothetical protein
MTASEIIFEVREDEMEGGFNAQALGHDIFTQADSVEELHVMVKDAVGCDFGLLVSDQSVRVRLNYHESLRQDWFGCQCGFRGSPRTKPERGWGSAPAPGAVGRALAVHRSRRKRFPASYFRTRPGLAAGAAAIPIHFLGLVPAEAVGQWA